jgi:hypothetical protein
MIEVWSAGVAMIDFSSSGVSTCASTIARSHPCVRKKYSYAFSGSTRATRSLRMCSCGQPRVCPVSCRTTRLYSDSGVLMVKPCRFMVGLPLLMRRTSVPRYDQYPSPSREMRISPCPPLSTNWMATVRLHAFMCCRIRLRRSAGVGSRKLTPSLRGLEPQYLAVTTAMRSGSLRSNDIPAIATGPKCGALAGLISLAVWAASTSRLLGSDLGVQTAAE